MYLEYIEEINENLKKNKVQYAITTKYRLRIEKKALAKNFSPDHYPQTLTEIEEVKQEKEILQRLVKVSIHLFLLF